MRLFVAILLIGMVGSLLTNMPSMPPSATSTHHVVDAEADTASDDATANPAPLMNMDGAVQLERKADGHFYADVEINGTAVTMLVDTGASAIALSREDARKAGIPTSIAMNEVVGRGADGSVHGEFITIDRIALGEKSAEQMPAMILNSGEQSLLGQSFLQKFASVEIRGDTMTLR
jgi:aspartyl protease family protein